MSPCLLFPFDLWYALLRRVHRNASGLGLLQRLLDDCIGLRRDRLAFCCLVLLGSSRRSFPSCSAASGRSAGGAEPLYSCAIVATPAVAPVEAVVEPAPAEPASLLKPHALSGATAAAANTPVRR